MKAISIRQPWAWAIFNLGKDIENRDWGEWYPALKDARRQILRSGTARQILIHASKGLTEEEYADAVATIRDIKMGNPFLFGRPVPEMRHLPRGGIVGTVELVDVVTSHGSPWFFGRVGLQLAAARALPFVPLRGELGLFNVSDELVAEIFRAAQPAG